MMMMMMMTIVNITIIKKEGLANIRICDLTLSAYRTKANASNVAYESNGKGVEWRQLKLRQALWLYLVFLQSLSVRTRRYKLVRKIKSFYDFVCLNDERWIIN